MMPWIDNLVVRGACFDACQEEGSVSVVMDEEGMEAALQQQVGLSQGLEGRE